VGVPNGSKVEVTVDYDRGITGKLKLESRKKKGPESRG